MRERLTGVERRAHAVLRRLYEERQGQRGVSVREIMLAVGYASTSTMHDTLCRLERKGYAERGTEALGRWVNTWRPTGYKPARFVPLVSMPGASH